jgi:peptidoglycan/LPS O-acetylase OafA/YrhL
VNSPPTDLPGHARHALTLLGLGELIAALYALRATVLHRDDYLASWQYALDLTVFGALALTGLGLMRQRRWAARISTGLLYLAFLGVLAMLSVYYDPGAWWYWVMPPLLPALGYAIYLLRKSRGWLRRGW